MLARKSRFTLLLAVLGTFLSPSLGCSPEATEERAQDPLEVDRAHSSPPTVVMVSIDTLRADHLSLYGYSRLTSPRLDAFAAEGTVFTDASSPSPWTLPAHASMFTGRYPLGHRVVQFDSALPDDVTSLAEILGQHGYETAAVVNSAWLKKEPFRTTKDFDKYLYVEDKKDRRSPSTWVTDQAISWINERGDKPLFLFVHYFDVHADYTSLPEYERLFVTPYEGKADGTAWQMTMASIDDDYLEMCQENYDPLKCRVGTSEEYLAIDSSAEKIRYDDTDLRYIKELYDAGIRQLDTELGRLLSTLEEQGLEETLVVITSDHGEEFMEHGRMSHFLTVYQEILRVPLIFRGASIPSKLRIAKPVSLVDIVPTVLSIAGVPVPADVDGMSLLPLMEGGVGAAFDDRLLYGEASGGHSYHLMMGHVWPIYRSVRKGPHKLIYDSKLDRTWLYDLATDPLEQEDVSKKYPEVHAELLEEMSQRYENFTPNPSPEDRVKIDSDELERLRALGYLP